MGLNFDSFRFDQVQTTRDQQGVWFLTGPPEASIYSIYEAMGYAVVEDRLWQSELFRRSGRGTLAEIFGKKYLKQDIYVRTTAYTDSEINEQFEALSVDAQLVVRGYVAGINRRIEEVLENLALLPLEFHFLGFQPELWTRLDLLSWMVFLQRVFNPDTDSLDQVRNAVVFTELKKEFPDAYLGMFEDLNWGNDPEALTYIPPAYIPPAYTPGEAVLSTVMGEPLPEAASYRALFSHGPLAQPFARPLAQPFARPLAQPFARPLARPNLGAEDRNFPDLSRTYSDLKKTLEENEVALKELNAKVKMGSYAWAISGEKTKSGNPILYSGPQMGFSVPAIVFEGSIRAGGLEVSGMSVVGMPGIIIGRTPHHAWSMQVGHAHTVDHYLETSDHVFFNRTETIRVAGEDTVYLPVYRTVHGPVISPTPYLPPNLSSDQSLDQLLDQSFYQSEESSSEGPIIAWKYSHWGYELKTIEGMLQLARAESPEEFGEGIKYFGLSQHFTYVDRDGNIGYWMSGRDPVRPSGADYRLPQPTENPAEWDSAVIRTHVHDLNNKQGYYAGWNNKSHPDYPNNSARVYGVFQRAHMIDDYLSSHNQLSFEDVRDLAIDIATTRSLGGGGNPWKFIEVYFLEAVQSAPTRKRRRALKILKNWDGHFVDGPQDLWTTSPDLADAWVLATEWIDGVMKLTFEDELSVGKLEYSEFNQRKLFNVLLHALAGKRSSVANHYNWFQNSFDTEAPQTSSEIILVALDRVLADLGRPPWGEGDRGEIVFKHDILGTLHTAPLSSRSTWAQTVEMGSSGPVRIETFIPLGQSGTILIGEDKQRVFDENFFSMAPYFDSFEPRTFPGFD